MKGKFNNMFFAFTTFLIVLLIFSNVENVSAAESITKVNNAEITDEEFQEFKSKGYYGEDVTLEMLNQPYERKSLLLLEEKSQEITINSLDNYTPKAGDILITNDTSYGGITGHTGIVTSSGKILHYPNPNVGIKHETLAQWNARYDKTNVWRVSSSIIANKAASWAYLNYYATNSDAEYQINTDLYSKDPTYCSKLVWQAYYYGAGSSVIDAPLTKIVRPYDLPAYFTSYPNLIVQEFIMR